MNNGMNPHLGPMSNHMNSMNYQTIGGGNQYTREAPYLGGISGHGNMGGNGTIGYGGGTIGGGNTRKF